MYRRRDFDWDCCDRDRYIPAYRRPPFYPGYPVYPSIYPAYIPPPVYPIYPPYPGYLYPYGTSIF